MTNKEARKLAKQLGAKVMPFVQFNGYCNGYVSWWIRNRARNKTIFNLDYFDFFNDKRYIPTTEKKGELKAKHLQGQLIGNHEANVAYITKGHLENKFLNINKTHKENKSKTEKEVLDFVEKKLNIEVGDEAENIIEIFENAAKDNCFCEISIFTSGGAHAIGLDCTKTEVCYFDPNVGQFEFKNIKDVCQWWKTCYIKRDENEKGAFDILRYRFSYEFYKKIF